MSGAGAAGAELTGARLIYRPEIEDLLLRMRVTSLPGVTAGRCIQVSAASCPGVSTGAGAPTVLYGAELRMGETRYEIRALRAAGSTAPHFALYRCAPECTEHAAARGSLGTTGNEVLVAVPLSAFGASEGTAVTDIRAFTAAGETGNDAVLPLDEIDLGSSAIPDARVELAIAPASTPQDEVSFSVRADVDAGRFSGSLPASPGSHRAWARACMGDACGPPEHRGIA